MNEILCAMCSLIQYKATCSGLIAVIQTQFGEPVNVSYCSAFKCDSRNQCPDCSDEMDCEFPTTHKECKPNKGVMRTASTNHGYAVYVVHCLLLNVRVELQIIDCWIRTDEQNCSSTTDDAAQMESLSDAIYRRFDWEWSKKTLQKSPIVLLY